MAETDTRDLLIEQGVLGVLADAWWKSDIGKYVIQRSLTETQEIIAKLKVVDPYDVHKIAQLQMDWQAAEKALIWLQEAIRAGRSAEAILQNQADSKEMT